MCHQIGWIGLNYRWRSIETIILSYLFGPFRHGLDVRRSGDIYEMLAIVQLADQWLHALYGPLQYSVQKIVSFRILRDLLESKTFETKAHDEKWVYFETN